jgi:hypothetical protein
MATDEQGAALVISCPADDLAGVVVVLAQHPVALLPVGGVGQLGRAAGVTELLVVEVGPEGPLPAVTWRGALASATPLDAELEQLLPASWLRRHPDAYARSRGAAAAASVMDEHDRNQADDDDEVNDEDVRAQIFLPVTTLAQLPSSQWLFANELVSKQRRQGRRFAPRVPAIVTLPEG